jgi:hypothetical protein
MLMSPHDRAVDHRVFIVRVGRKILENVVPYARFGPPAEAEMDCHPIPENLRQVAPRDPCPIAIEHSINEKPVVLSGYTDRARPPRKKAADPFPLVIA